MNHLPIHELREKLRSPKTRPTCPSCDTHDATDIHHINGHHHDSTPSNLTPWCKRCHNEHHHISDNITNLSLAVRQLDSIQRQRIAMGNRLIAYKKLGYEAEVAHQILDSLKELEKSTKKLVAKMLKDEPIYTRYLKKIKGVGPSIAAFLIAEIGDPSRFETISALWAYCGLDVSDGSARRRTKGIVSNWNQRLRSVCAKRLTDQFIKLKGKKNAFGRELYDQYKAFYVARDGDKLSKGHVDNRARRKVAKVFLACLWVAWREIRELPVTQPYAVDKLGHSHIVIPDEWAGAGWAA